MGDIFSYDGKLMQWGRKLADLMVLNVLTVILSLPLLTAGTAFTAMHYALYKLSKDEDASVVKDYFRGFAQNFWKSTVLWVIFAVVAAVLVGDYYYFTRVSIQKNTIGIVLLVFGVVIWLVSFTWGLILQARYENGVRETLKNSLIVGVSQVKYTVPILLLKLIPLVLLFFVPQIRGVVLIVGFSGCGYLQAKLYSKVYEKCEENAEVLEDKEIDQ